MAESHREASRRLFEIAEQQQGFFTTKQAKAAGFAENTHPYHVQVGNWICEHRGIYRLALFPVTDRPDLVLWALWSRNRDEEIEGVYSHHTALSLYDLSDLNPAKLHMTVPTDFRRNSERNTRPALRRSLRKRRTGRSGLQVHSASADDPRSDRGGYRRATFHSPGADASPRPRPNHSAPDLQRVNKWTCPQDGRGSTCD